MPEAFIDALQWPAMAATLIASWMVGSQRKRKRNWGFWLFIVSNLLWLAWGWHTQAWALMVLQLGLFGLNLRGARKNDPDCGDADEQPQSPPRAADTHRGGTGRRPGAQPAAPNR
ncbi:hypothetical protein [Azohydromonas aeria]|uniref:hypothetical protein n=1 Tax=Azohydromonas aeria TaxID=2590212 RepID=UPI001E528794|nr:hypothetical protein [Azohydromonas aeria]